MKFILKLSIIFGSLTLTCCNPSQNGSPNDALLRNRDRQSETMLCLGANSETTDGYGGGNGTKENPYLICTVDQFKSIQGNMDKKRFFRLTSDLDFSNEGNIRIIAMAPFASIDGGNHSLKNITIEHGHGFRDNGIFGQLVQDLNGNKDEIKNLIIENITILGDGKEDGGGVIAAANFGGVISNVHVTGKIQIEFPAEGKFTSSAIGGLVGRNFALIENSSFEGEISGIYNVGGIAGLNEGTIRNSNSSGTFHGINGIGGVVGVQIKSGILDNNQSDAAIIASQNAGPLVGIVCDSYISGACVER